MDSRLRSEAGDHAWKFFKQHADQRMALFRFFLALLAGYAILLSQLLQDGQYGILILVSLIFCFLSAGFYLLDVRTKKLLAIGEKTLKNYQSFVAKAINDPSFMMLEKADKKEFFRVSYKVVFQAIYSGTFILSLCSALYAFGETLIR